MTTPEFLKELEKSFSKKEISEKCKIGLRTIYDWELGAEMKFSTASKICKTLKLNLWKILKQNQ